jgi:hypothetical protein
MTTERSVNMIRRTIPVVLVAQVVLLVAVAAAQEAKKEYRQEDILGKYNVPMMFGGTVEFAKDGICTMTLNAPLGSKKGPLVIREKYEVKGDIIHFEQIEVDGKKSDGEKSQQQIISVSDESLVLKEVESGKVFTYKRIKPPSIPAGA